MRQKAIEWLGIFGIISILLILAFANPPERAMSLPTGRLLTPSTLFSRYEDIRKLVPYETPSKAFLSQSLAGVAELLWSAGADFGPKPNTAFLLYRGKHLYSLIYWLPSLHQDATLWEQRYLMGTQKLKPAREVREALVIMTIHVLKDKLPKQRIGNPDLISLSSADGRIHQLDLWFSYLR